MNIFKSSGSAISGTDSCFPEQRQDQCRDEGMCHDDHPPYYPFSISISTSKHASIPQPVVFRVVHSQHGEFNRFGTFNLAQALNRSIKMKSREDIVEIQSHGEIA